MATNHALAVAGRDVLCAALRVEVPSPDSMIGSMATVPLPGVATDEAAAALADVLYRVNRIEVPIGGWPVRAARGVPGDGTPPRHALLRLSAQRYNEIADYERLGASLARRLKRG